MEAIYRNLATLNQWGRGTGSERSFEVTELWHNGQTGQVTNKTRLIDPAMRASWISEEETTGTQGRTETLLVRLVWVDIDVKDQLIRQSEECISFLVRALGLDLAHEYARSCLAGATELPPREQGTDVTLASYCVCYTPKVAAVWSQRQPRVTNTKVRRLTQGMYFVQHEEKESLRMMASYGNWDLGVYKNALFPALSVALLLGAQIDHVVGTIKKDLRAVEKRTGHHKFASRHEAPAEEELSDLSATTHGTAAKLASTARKSKTLEKLLSFIKVAIDDSVRRRREAPPLDAAAAAPHQSMTAYDDDDDDVKCLVEGGALIKSHVSVLQDRQEMQVVDMEYTLKRTQVQIDALFSIIQQRDARHHLDLSQATHEIAHFSYRDSSSMKTLAVVTMLFLPGSFISALFSTNCFEWAGVDLRTDDMGVKPTPQFRLYWAITIPLTVVTFSVYFAWLAFQKRNRHRLFHSDEDVGNTPGRSLSMHTTENADRRMLARRGRDVVFEKMGSMKDHGR